MKSMRSLLPLLALMAGIALIVPKPASSYLSQYTAAGGALNRDHWDFSAFAVQWSVNPKVGSNITGSRGAVDVVAESFNTWLSAPNAALSVSRGADTSATGAAFDGTNLVCFSCSGDFTRDAETLAVTFTTTADGPGADDKHGGKSRFAGQILDGDILFNPSVSFNTDGNGDNDLQTIATHEIGHFFGLDHSAVVKAIMFPFAPPLERTLSYDDVAAIAASYPKGSRDVPTGSISGRVVMSDGSPVFGAHVFADSVTSALPYPGNIRKTPIGTLTMPDGTYQITGVPGDTYTVAAEPLDQPVTNSDISGYAPAFGKSSVQTNFTTRWH